MADLITLSELRDIAKLNANVEPRRVAPAIDDAHLDAEKVLGREGFALMKANAPTFAAQGAQAAAYATMFTDYVQPFMVWRAMQRALVDLYAEPDRAGVFKRNAEGFESVSGSELGNAVAQARDRAEARLERLLVHLQDNAATFTWFNRSQRSEERITRSNPAGLVVRRSARQDHYRG